MDSFNQDPIYIEDSIFLFGPKHLEPVSTPTPLLPTLQVLNPKDPLDGNGVTYLVEKIGWAFRPDFRPHYGRIYVVGGYWNEAAAYIRAIGNLFILLARA